MTEAATLTDNFLIVFLLYPSPSKGGGGVPKFVPSFFGGGREKSPTGDTFDQLPGEMSQIRGKLAYNVGDYLVSSPKGAVLVSTSGTESSNPRPHSLNGSSVEGLQP